MVVYCLEAGLASSLRVGRGFIFDDLAEISQLRQIINFDFNYDQHATTSHSFQDRIKNLPEIVMKNKF